MSNLKRLRVLTVPAALIVSAALSAQAPTAAPTATPAAPAQFMSQSLGVHVFPAKGQTTSQQQNDESYCFNWAKSNTGFDPLAPPPSSATASAQQPGNPAAGAPVKHTVGGAAAGAAIGAVAGDAGKGAAIGATAGAVSGVAARRRGEHAQAQQQQEQSQQTAAAQQQVATQKASYNKAFSACMQGKGYTVQ
jgi:YMGG-like Gly-zipper